MIYSVRAKLVAEMSEAFYRQLTDGTIERQRPDGSEIVSSMDRARIADDGTVRWTETCFCPTPLKHERETVLDRYFSNIETEQIDTHISFGGESLMDHLAAAGLNHV